MLLFDRANWPWFVLSLVAAAAATVWYFVAGLGQAEWPGGSSLPGFTFGVVGGLIILFEFLLWPCKAFRARRWLGSAQLWLRAHI